MSRIITIVGTNASGKSAIGIELAKEFNGEIISADSRQVFKGFDLCCGKITKTEARIVPHHMIDIVEIGTPFSVADYQKQAHELIKDIDERNRIPFIVGGTGLYINSIIYDYQFTDEKTDYEYRDYLNELDVCDLQRLLPKDIFDFLSANNSDFNNKRRLIRYLEKIKNDETFTPSRGVFEKKFDTLQIGITWPKEILHQRIEERLRKRIEAGMIGEVEEYLNNGGDPNVLYKLGLEYRYIMWYVTGKYASLDEFFIEMSTAIKQFSRKQIKWFKRDKSIHWLNMEEDYMTEARTLINAFLGYNN